MAAMGTALRLSKKLTLNEASAPRPNCIAPINADAVPAFLAKGASESAEAFGLVVPTQQSKINIIQMVPASPNQPFIAPIINIKVVINCTARAANIICSLLNFLSNRLFTWLDPINPIESPAKIHPKVLELTLNTSIKTSGEPETYTNKPAKANEPVKA